MGGGSGEGILGAIRLDAVVLRLQSQVQTEVRVGVEALHEGGCVARVERSAGYALRVRRLVSGRDRQPARGQKASGDGRLETEDAQSAAPHQREVVGQVEALGAEVLSEVGRGADKRV